MPNQPIQFRVTGQFQRTKDGHSCLSTIAPSTVWAETHEGAKAEVEAEIRREQPAAYNIRLRAEPLCPAVVEADAGGSVRLPTVMDVVRRMVFSAR